MERIEKKLDQIETKVDAILLVQVVQGKDISQNTRDLSEHIRRTNILESRIQKLWYAIYLGAGAAIANSWPAISALLKVIQ